MFSHGWPHTHKNTHTQTHTDTHTHAQVMFYVNMSNRDTAALIDFNISLCNQGVQQDPAAHDWDIWSSNMSFSCVYDHDNAILTWLCAKCITSVLLPGDIIDGHRLHLFCLHNSLQYTHTHTHTRPNDRKAWHQCVFQTCFWTLCIMLRTCACLKTANISILTDRLRVLCWENTISELCIVCNGRLGLSVRHINIQMFFESKSNLISISICTSAERVTCGECLKEPVCLSLPTSTAARRVGRGCRHRCAPSP